MAVRGGLVGRFGAGVEVHRLAENVAAGDGARAWDAGPLAVAAPASGGSGGTPRTLCVLDGRVSNVAVIARELGGPDEDAERVLATGYERWGEELLRRCRGEFSLVIWDRERSVGLAARDRLGHRGLFLGERGSTLLFAWEVRPLLALLARRPAPDRVAVAHWLHGSGPPEGRTLFEGIRRLAPGRFVRLRRDGWSEHDYWQPRRDGGTVTRPDEAEAALRAGLEGAVSRAASLGPVGVLLSGGLDSAAVAALAAQQARRSGSPDPHGYSGTFPATPSADESRQISIVRRHIGLAGTERRHSVESALMPALEFLLAYDVPSVSPNAYLWRPLVRGAAADGVSVILDGEGGDELLGCAPYLIADALRSGRPDRAAALARRLPGMGPRPPARWVRQALVRYGLRGAIPFRTHRRLRSWRASAGDEAPHPWITRDLVQLHSDSDDPWAFKRDGGPRWRSGFIDAVVSRSEAIGAHDQLRREADLCGVEFRHPLRDPDLIDAVLAIDPRLGFDPELDRPLARSALRCAVPDEVRLSTRKPHFNAPLTAALAGPDAPAIGALLTGPDMQSGEYVRREGLASLMDGGARPRVLSLWRVVMLECWLRSQWEGDDFATWVADRAASEAVPRIRRGDPPRAPGT